MRMTREMAGRAGALLVLALGLGRTGVAYQRSNPTPSPPSNYPPPMQNNNNSAIPGRISSLDDQSAAIRELEEKRSRAMNSERQRAMVKEANQMVQTAAELEAAVTQGIDGAAREDEARRAEAIEKLAKNVKERMRGTR